MGEGLRLGLLALGVVSVLWGLSNVAGMSPPSILTGGMDAFFAFMTNYAVSGGVAIAGALMIGTAIKMD